MSGRDTAETTFLRRSVSQTLSFLQIFCTQFSKAKTLNITSENFQPFWRFSDWVTAKVGKSGVSPGITLFSFMARQPLLGQGLLTVEASRSDVRHPTLGRTALNEGSVRRRDHYLITHNTDKWQTSMPPAGWEPAIQASKQTKTHTWNRAAIGIGIHFSYIQEEISVRPFVTCSSVGPSAFLSQQHAWWDNLDSIHFFVEAFGIMCCLLFTTDGTLSSADPVYYRTARRVCRTNVPNSVYCLSAAHTNN
jgi:hypothetical protein